jgi:Fibronectin type III domain
VPQIRLGNTLVANNKLGTTQMQKVYLGTTLVWTPVQDWVGSAAALTFTARSSTWGPALVPAGRTVHWDASHEASFTYLPDTARVAQWADLSGNSWWIKNDNPNQTPLREIGYNGIPVVHFEADQWLVHWIDSGTPAEINLPQPITVHVVAAARPYVGSSFPVGLIGGAGFGAEGAQITVQSDGTLLFAAGNYVNYPGYNRDQHIITAVFNGSSSVQRIDGVQIGTGDVGTAGIKRLQIGITHQLMEVVACEYAFYNRVLTGPEITYNENLLQAKWFKPPGVWTGSAATVTIAGSARTWSTGATPAFRPDLIENCWGWWDASDASTFSYSSGVSVTQWRDKTSAGRHLFPLVPALEPDRNTTINGRSALTFDGSSWLLISESPVDYPPAEPTTVFIVASSTIYARPPDFSGIILVGGSGIGRVPADQGSFLTYAAGISADYTIDGNVHIYAAVFDRANSQQRLDSVQIGTKNTGPGALAQFRIGTGGFAGHNLIGKVAEACVYTRTLNSTEISEIESYLTAKWFGPPLPQTWTGSSATLTYTATSATWGAVGLPGAPTSLNATAGNAQCPLTWTAPVSNGGSALTNYTVQYRTTVGPGSWNTFSHTASTATSITVTGLANGTGYDFQVAAVNANGTGPFSSTASATPVAGPTIYTDNFNRANGALTTPWVGVDNNHSIVSNQVAVGPANPTVSRYNDTIGADQWVEGDLAGWTPGGGVIYPAIRVNSGDFYYAWNEGNNVAVYKRVGGSYSKIGSTSPTTYSSSCKVRLEAQGTTVRCYVDGALAVTATDASIATGQPGILSANGAGTTFDNFRAGELPWTP